MGRTMLQTFMHLNKTLTNPHKIILLSRSPNQDLTAQGIDVRPVDYKNHSALVRALSNVDTLLSVIGGSADAIRDAQMALIRAAEETGVRRFAPSEYAGNGYEGVELYASKIPVWEAAKKSKMECTRFNCGLFMSALATGTPKGLTEVGIRENRVDGEAEALAGLRPWKYVVDFVAGTADFPGDGDAPIVLTEMRDVAGFVFRALDLEVWPKESGMRGVVSSFREIVEVAERVQGRNWLTRSTSIHELEAGTKSEDFGAKFYNQTLLASTKGWMLVSDELNQAFPDFKPTTCEAFIEKWWGGVELGEAEWVESTQVDPTQRSG